MRALLVGLLVAVLACESKGEPPPSSAPAAAASPSTPSSNLPLTSASSAAEPAQTLPAWRTPPAELGEVLEIKAPICSRSESLHLGSESSRSYVVSAPSVKAAVLEQHFRSFAKSAGLPVIDEPMLGRRVEAKSGRAGATLMQSHVMLTVMGEPAPGAARDLVAEGPPELSKIIEASGAAAIVDLDVTRFSNGQREIRMQLATKKSAADLGKVVGLRDYGDGLFASEKQATAPTDWHVMVSKDSRGLSVTASQPLAKLGACQRVDEDSAGPGAHASARPSADRKQEDQLMEEMMGGPQAPR